MSKRRLITVVACFLVSVPLMARVAVVGVIIQAKGAHLGSSEVSTGTTIFDGDQLDTDDKGLVRISSGKVRLDVLSSSTIRLAQGPCWAYGDSDAVRSYSARKKSETSNC